MVYVFLTEGFEPIEAVTPVDMLRRAGIGVALVSLCGELPVNGSRDITVVADMMFDDTDFSDATMLVLPGGPGTSGLLRHEGLCRLLVRFAAEGKPIAAICAAPSVLGRLGILSGKRATVYPGCGDGIDGVEFSDSFVECDGNIITAIGPAASVAFSARIIEFLKGRETSGSVCDGMMCRNERN